MLAEWMAGPGADAALTEVAHTVNHHRAHPKFATVAARDREQAIAGLRALAAGQSARGVVPAPRRGPQAGHGVRVLRTGIAVGRAWPANCSPTNRRSPRAVDEIEPVFVEQVGFSLRASSPTAGRSAETHRSSRY